MIGFTSSNGSYNRLWKIFEREKYLSKGQFKEALKRAKKENRYLTEVLLGNSSLPREKLLRAFSEFYGAPVVNLRKKVISPLVLNLIPKEVAEQHSVIVFKKIRNVINVATTTPGNIQTIQFIKKKTGLEPKVHITTPEEIGHALKKYTSEIAEEFAKIIEDSVNETLGSEDPAEKMAEYLPIIKMVNTIIERALSQNASDIHFEPTARGIVTRFRIDGLLTRILELPREVLPPLITRIKLLSNLKIDEHRLPQDGRFKFIYNDRDVAIRVSIIPMLNGAKAVLRLLDTKEKQFTLRSLGLNQDDFQTLKEEILKPNGMMLVTGPTGSGKTTTLYTLLRMLNKENVNICTIEDPIEYGIEGINQTQVNPAAGLTFANGLRSLLRQDPNILMVGEIRDADTADIAMNAAMTGHLVLSTLHTNNAFLAIQRLIEMGVQPFLAASVVNVIIAQRLVRRVCKYCTTRSWLSGKIFDEYKSVFDLEGTFSKLQKRQLILPDRRFVDLKISHGRGCAKCNGTGYQGRVGIYEVVRVNDEIHAAIVRNPSAESIRDVATRQGTLTIVEDGLLKVFNGLTTFEEVLRVTK